MTRGRAGLAAAAAVLLASAAGLGARAEAPSKYAAMTEEIGVLLDEALGRYKKGDVEGAKRKTETAYFEVFENLEGPIRINVSAQANYELEEEFTVIRAMFARKEPVPAVAARIAAFMPRLRRVVPRLEGGVELTAAGVDDEAPSPAAGADGIAPAWLEVRKNIEAGLAGALEAYERGDKAKAADLVSRTLHEHYNNGVLEVAIRSHVSQARNFDHASRFSDVEGLIRSGADAASVSASMSALLDELRKDLRGLPLVAGAVPAKTAAAAAERDWRRTAAGLFRKAKEAARRAIGMGGGNR
ncbi:MAG: hypothetical protein HYV14_17615 [Elusimicrobia bacterium]|nr:hypothetical protein [Elusimicrobiota bacterium]